MTDPLPDCTCNNRMQLPRAIASPIRAATRQTATTSNACRTIRITIRETSSTRPLAAPSLLAGAATARSRRLRDQSATPDHLVGNILLRAVIGTLRRATK